MARAFSFHGSTKPRLVVLNPTCLDVIDAQRNWIASLGVELVAEPAFRTLKMEEVDNVIAGAHAVILPAAPRTAPRADQMNRARELAVLSVAASGFEWLDVSTATRHGIVVTNVTGGLGSGVVAEMAFALMLAVARQVPHHQDKLRAGDLSRGVGVALHGKTLGLVGLGAVARAMVPIAHGFGMTVAAWARNPDRDFAVQNRIELLPLDDLLGRADVVSLHVKLNDQTRGLIGARELSVMKPSAILLNTARPELVDEPALARMLLDGRLAGLGMDDPPLDRASPMLQLSNCVFTPHLGNRAAEGMAWVLRTAVENAAAVLRGQRPANVVNPEVYAG